MIRKAQRKPIECEFMEYTKDNRDEVVKWLRSWYVDFPTRKQFIYIEDGDDDYIIVEIGDYIVCDVDLYGNVIYTAMSKEMFEHCYTEIKE